MILRILAIAGLYAAALPLFAAGQARGVEYARTVGRGVLEDPQVQVFLIPGRQGRATVDGHGVAVVPGLPGLDIHQVAQGPIEEFRPDQ